MAAPLLAVSGRSPSPRPPAGPRSVAPRHGRPPRIRHLGGAQPVHGLGLPEAVGDPHRLPGAGPRGPSRAASGRCGRSGRCRAWAWRSTGADGKSYTFRTSDKDPTRILPPEWADTAPAKLFQDATTANHPGVGLRGAAARRSGGRPAHDPALRLHARRSGARASSARRSAAGRARSRSTRSRGRTARPGFAGATEILSTRRALEAASRGEGAGRHARAPARAALRPLDRRLGPAQQAVALAAARRGTALRAAARGPRPGLLEVRRPAALDGARHAPEVHGLDGSLRELRGVHDPGHRGGPVAAVGDGPPAFAEAAADLTARLTDAVIDDAVRRLPPEWYAIDGREPDRGAPEAPRHAAGRPRPSTTGASPEGGRPRHRRGRSRPRPRAWPDGRLELGIAHVRRRRALVPADVRSARDARGPPVSLRRGGPRGDRGPAGRAGHPARDRRRGRRTRSTNRRSGGTRFYDFEGRRRSRRAPAPRGPHEPWERRPAKPEETPWLEWRDWGSRTHPQLPAVVGAGPRRSCWPRDFTRQTWGFRKFPYASLQWRAAAVQHRAGTTSSSTTTASSAGRTRSMYLGGGRPGLRAREPQLLRRRATTRSSRAAGGRDESSSTPTPTPTESASGRAGR